ELVRTKFLPAIFFAGSVAPLPVILKNFSRELVGTLFTAFYLGLLGGKGCTPLHRARGDMLALPLRDIEHNRVEWNPLFLGPVDTGVGHVMNWFQQNRDVTPAFRARRRIQPCVGGIQ